MMFERVALEKAKKKAWLKVEPCNKAPAAQSYTPNHLQKRLTETGRT
jgi:hypothetical protein